ncbi:hypothetical protein [Nocardioides sp. TF02-7]|uniref:hypothetical protein n=1 Tax=Nocardioides sp. TF02-7 TaxID=2917724 RepID=UPI001F069581|nr:hypothetical protein [Nocardioides sp. TF02-7]UMG94225.1 hypothetical protein MF408_09505 [Nocardioides sp. TF02-7]
MAADEDGWVWAAAGAVPLRTAPRADGDRLAPAVFHAWWGRRPDQAAPAGPRLRLAARQPDPGLATALAAALPAGWSTDPTAPDTAAASAADWVTGAAVREALADVVVLLEPRWVLLRDPDLLWLPDAPASADAVDGLRITPLAGPGVVVEGPYPRLERLTDAPPRRT